MEILELKKSQTPGETKKSKTIALLAFHSWYSLENEQQSVALQGRRHHLKGRKGRYQT